MTKMTFPIPILTALLPMLAALLAPVTLCAQSGAKYPYVKSTTDPVVVCRDAAGGIKAVALYGNGVVKRPAGMTEAHDEQSPIARASAQFRVAKADCSAANALGVPLSSGYTWANAVLACTAYSELGFVAGNWRLPTQRELMLIGMMGSTTANTIAPAGGLSLKGVTGFVGCGRGVWYWTSTHYAQDVNTAWRVSPDKSYGLTSEKTETRSVRCVRDE